MNLKGLIENGLPVRMAVFHRTVTSAMGEPETAFFASREQTTKLSRVANMYYTSEGLVCDQNGTVTIVPLANVCYARLK